MTAVVPESVDTGGDFDELARRVDEAVTALAELDPTSRAVAEEVKAAVEAVHRAGLVTIVRRLREDPATRAVLYELVDEPVVHLLLSIHGIVRPDPVTHANRVLAAVRPQLHSHGGDVTLVRVDDGTAYVRLEGACNGCSMSSVTLRNMVEGALIEGVPSIAAVEVLPNEPTPTLIPVESLMTGRVERDPSADGWARVGPAAEVADGVLTRAQLNTVQGAVDVIIVSIDHRLAAYRNECAHQGLPLDNAILDVDAGTLTCPWHGFSYDATSGECLSAPGAQLEQLPLRVDRGDLWVRVQT
ncbi:NifU family protein [Mycolicibacterium iranicum]|uniref:NifU family protein n=1 Tax=Mycolicibacterium iranicum TaxID=912594 RepID=A0ABT4HJL3_MYCIR|nr:NifU family protein [Mycolicibacterium iranicum]MCZ0730143.1 NifU family protein [Mycolicibacterium iranicum]